VLCLCPCLAGIFFLKNSKADWFKSKSESDVVPKAKDPDQTKLAVKRADLAGTPGFKVPGFACPLRRSHGTEVGAPTGSLMALHTLSKSCATAASIGMQWAQGVLCEGRDV
jgi:hypothetical protein